jgi:WD40 repeat protein
MADQPGAVRARIFVSYSRKDAAFVDRLVAELIARGYDAFLDREDISGGEAWKERLEQLILQADAVVFVISPDSIASPVCNWETQRTVELGKRLIPVCLKRVEDDSVPAQLSRLNYIFADQPELFDDTIRRIAEASDVDIAWVREHTRQVGLATRWEARERKADALLRGDELGAAERWLSQREPNAPDLPEALVEFLQASRSAEADALDRERKNLRRMRGLQFGVGGLMAAAALILIAAGYGVTRLMSGLGARTSSTLATIARQAADAGRYDSAARHALAGLTGSRWWLIGYDATAAELQLRRAVAESRMAALFVAHSDPVEFVAFSSDGALIVTGSADETARVWNVATGAPVGASLRAQDDVLEALFSPDGSRVVTVERSLGGAAQIWDVHSSRPVGGQIGSGEGIFVSAIAFARHRTQLVVAISDGRLQRIDPRTGQLIEPEIAIMPGGMPIAAFSADGSKLATGDFDSDPFFVWNLSGERPVRVQLGGRLPDVSHAVFSPDGSKLLTLEPEQDAARLWDSNSGALVGQLTTDSIVAAFSPDGSTLATSLSEGAIQLWDGRTGAPKGEPLRGHRGAISALVFSPDGAQLASASHDGTVRVWPIQSPGEVELVVRGHEGEVRHIAFSPDGALLASASEDGTVRVSEVGPAHHRQIALTGQEEASITDVAFAARGNLMATSANIGTIVLRNAETGAPIGAPLVGDEGSMVTLALAPGDERLASGSSTGAVQIWNVENASADGEAMIAERDMVVALTYAPDGSKIAVGHNNGATELWDVAARRLVGTARHDHSETINAITFSPDGARFATASDEGSVRVWNASTGAPIGSPLVHEGKVLDIRFETPRSLLTAGDNGGRRWDVESGAVQQRWEIEDGYVSAAAIAADGSRMGFAFPGSPAMQIELSTGARRSEPVDDNGSTWATRIAFSPDGVFMATGYAHGFIRLWDARTGVLLTEQMETNGNFLFRLRFSPDGRRIFSSSVHGGAWLTVPHPAIYEPLPQLLRRACETTLRGGLSRFTRDEFRQAPVLNPATDADVCKPANLWTRIGLNFQQ